MVYSLYPSLSDLSKILSFIFHMYLTSLMIFSCHKVLSALFSQLKPWLCEWEMIKPKSQVLPTTSVIPRLFI